MYKSDVGLLVRCSKMSSTPSAPVFLLPRTVSSKYVLNLDSDGLQFYD